MHGRADPLVQARCFSSLREVLAWCGSCRISRDEVVVLRCAKFRSDVTARSHFLRQTCSVATRLRPTPYTCHISSDEAVSLLRRNTAAEFPATDTYSVAVRLGLTSQNCRIHCDDELLLHRGTVGRDVTERMYSGEVFLHCGTFWSAFLRQVRNRRTRAAALAATNTSPSLAGHSGTSERPDFPRRRLLAFFVTQTSGVT